MSQLSENDWMDILDDIQDQKAVLLIGPELFQTGGKPLNPQLREHLLKRHAADIAFYTKSILFCKGLTIC